MDDDYVDFPRIIRYHENEPEVEEHYVEPPKTTKIKEPKIKDPCDYYDIEVTVEAFVRWWPKNCKSRQCKWLTPILEAIMAEGGGHLLVREVFLEHLSYWIHKCRWELLEEHMDADLERQLQQFLSGQRGLPIAELPGADYMSEER